MQYDIKLNYTVFLMNINKLLLKKKGKTKQEKRK